MRFIECSIEGLRDESLRLANLIEESFTPDAVAYLAKGGYLIGKTVSQYFSVPLIELDKSRSGENFKRENASLLQRLPRLGKKVLRHLEVWVRAIRPRGAQISTKLTLTQRYSLPVEATAILIVDDSIDTGSSMLEAKRAVESAFPDAVVKVAALNVFSLSKGIVEVHAHLYEDRLLSLPSSKDNREYEVFLDLYRNDALEVGSKRDQDFKFQQESRHMS